MVRPMASRWNKACGNNFANVFLLKARYCTVGRNGDHSVFSVLAAAFPSLTRAFHPRHGLAACEMNKVLELAGWERARFRTKKDPADGPSLSCYRFAQRRWFNPDVPIELGTLRKNWDWYCSVVRPAITFDAFCDLVRQAILVDANFKKGQIERDYPSFAACAQPRPLGVGVPPSFYGTDHEKNQRYHATTLAGQAGDGVGFAGAAGVVSECANQRVPAGAAEGAPASAPSSDVGSGALDDSPKATASPCAPPALDPVASDTAAAAPPPPPPLPQRPDHGAQISATSGGEERCSDCTGLEPDQYRAVPPAGSNDGAGALEQSGLKRKRQDDACLAAITGTCGGGSTLGSDAAPMPAWYARPRPHPRWGLPQPLPESQPTPPQAYDPQFPSPSLPAPPATRRQPHDDPHPQQAQGPRLCQWPPPGAQADVDAGAGTWLADGAVGAELGTCDGPVIAMEVDAIESRRDSLAPQAAPFQVLRPIAHRPPAPPARPTVARPVASLAVASSLRPSLPPVQVCGAPSVVPPCISEAEREGAFVRCAPGVRAVRAVPVCASDPAREYHLHSLRGALFGPVSSAGAAPAGGAAESDGEQGERASGGEQEETAREAVLCPGGTVKREGEEREREVALSLEEREREVALSLEEREREVARLSRELEEERARAKEERERREAAERKLGAMQAGLAQGALPLPSTLPSSAHSAHAVSNLDVGGLLNYVFPPAKALPFPLSSPSLPYLPGQLPLSVLPPPVPPSFPSPVPVFESPSLVREGRVDCQ